MGRFFIKEWLATCTKSSCGKLIEGDSSRDSGSFNTGNRENGCQESSAGCSYWDLALESERRHRRRARPVARLHRSGETTCSPFATVAFTWTASPSPRSASISSICSGSSTSNWRPETLWTRPTRWFRPRTRRLRELHEMGFRTIRFFALPWGPAGPRILRGSGETQAPVRRLGQGP